MKRHILFFPVALIIFFILLEVSLRDGDMPDSCLMNKFMLKMLDQVDP